jgi:hypothetical protein
VISPTQPRHRSITIPSRMNQALPKIEKTKVYCRNSSSSFEDMLLFEERNNLFRLTIYKSLDGKFRFVPGGGLCIKPVASVESRNRIYVGPCAGRWRDGSDMVRGTKRSKVRVQIGYLSRLVRHCRMAHPYSKINLGRFTVVRRAQRRWHVQYQPITPFICFASRSWWSHSLTLPDASIVPVANLNAGSNGTPLVATYSSRVG